MLPLTLAAIFLIGTGMIQLFGAYQWQIPATEGYSTLLIEYEIVAAQTMGHGVSEDEIVITNADVAAELESSAGLSIDKKKIELAEPIRHLGSYEVAIRLAQDIIPKIKVTVTAKETEQSAE